MYKAIKRLFVLGLSFISLALAAQNFSEQIVVKGLYHPRQTEAADLDADGWIDVVVRTEDGELNWLRNLGDGNFGQPKTLFPADVSTFHFFDRDDDGDPDLLLTTLTEGLRWFENTGGAEFSLVTVIDTFASNYSPHFADIDGDGDLDVVACAGGAVFWYEYLGNNTFESKDFVSWTTTTVNKVMSADMDGDGDTDIVSASFLNGSRIYRNNGDGTFEPVVSFGGSSRSAQLLDLDNDGDMDLLQCYGNNWVGWYENDGTGNFTSDIITSDLSSPQDVKGADVDNDGDLDVISVSHTVQKVVWVEQTAPGVFADMEEITDDFNAFNAVVVEDFYNNNKKSVLAVSYMYSLIHLYKNQGNPNFNNGTRIFPKYKYPADGHYTDINEDGVGDIVFIADTEEVFAAFGTCNGVFGEPEVIATTGTSGSALSLYHLRVGDLDLDGDEDLLLFQNYSNTYIQYALNNGDGSFAPFVLLLEEVARDLKIADLSGDGLPDILVMTNNYEDALLYYPNLGDGTFGEAYVFPNVLPWDGIVEIGDLEGDGDLDVFLLKGIGDILSWYVNQGDGTFAAEQYIDDNTILGYRDFSLKDAEGDGDLDVFISRGGIWKMVWYENTGDNQFSLSNRHDLPLASGMYISTDVYQTFGDLDHDGLEDLIINDRNEEQLIWFRYLGGGAFAVPEILEEQSYFNILEATDIDFDNDTDLLVFEASSYQIAWRKNLINTDTSAIVLAIDSGDALPCLGEASGFIHINPNTIACDNYSISWANPGISGFEVNGLGDGWYTFTVSNTLGTTLTDSVQIIIPDALVLSGDGTAAEPDNGEGMAWVEVSGGVAPYTYLWSNPDAGMTDTLFNLNPGIYTVTVTDAVGCQQVLEVEIAVSEIQIDIVFEHSGPCHGEQSGYIQLIDLTNEGTYTIEWNDPNLSGFELSDLSPGTYIYTIENIWGLSLTDSIIITEPDPLILTGNASGSEPGTMEGIAWVVPEGGVPPYTYHWPDLTPGNTDTVTALNPGIYQVIVTDEGGCSESLEVTVDVLSSTFQVSDPLNIRIYPNLVTGDHIYVYTSRTVSRPVVINIINSSGQLLRQFQRAFLNKGDAFGLTGLPDGNYFFQIKGLPKEKVALPFMISRN